MLTTLLGGHVDAAWANPSECIEQYKAGQVRILAVGDTKRLEDFPDVPTFKEAGVDMVSYNWRGIGGPPRLPKSVVDYWVDVLGKMRATSDWKQGYLARVYQEDGWLVGDQLMSYVHKEHDQFKGVFEKLGMLKKWPVRLSYLEAVTAAALGAAAAFYLYLAWQLPVPRYTVASTPGFLPLVLGTLMLGLCAALLGKALLARGEQADAAVEFSAIGVAKIAGVLVALLGYVLLLETLGFLLSSFLFLVAVTPLFGRVPWWMWLGGPPPSRWRRTSSSSWSCGCGFPPACCRSDGNPPQPRLRLLGRADAAEPVLLLPRHGAGDRGRRAARARHHHRRRHPDPGDARHESNLGADHARRHLLRRAIRRIDHGDPDEPAGRVRPR